MTDTDTIDKSMNGEKYIEVVSGLTSARELHGLYVYAHGNTTSFGTKKGENKGGKKGGFTTVNYQNLGKSLDYKLAFVIMNACISYLGVTNNLVSPNGMGLGIVGILNPICGSTFSNDDYPAHNVEDNLKPGDQGTNK